MSNLTITAAGPLTIDVGKAESVHVHNSAPTTIITNAKRVEELEWAVGKMNTTMDRTAAENTSLRDRLVKTDATLMALCQALNLDPTGDPVAEVRARMARADVVAGLVAPLPLRIAMEVWPGPWTADGDTLTLVLADPGSLIHAEIEVQYGTYGGWFVRLNNRGLWLLLHASKDLAKALTIARSKVRKMVDELAKGVGP